MTPKEIAKYYISPLNPVLFPDTKGITTESIKEHELALEKAIESLCLKFAEIKCKETAKNVRHKAIDIFLEVYSEHEESYFKNEAQRQIMNIQFDDVKPTLSN